jgi:hypothetical protein
VKDIAKLSPPSTGDRSNSEIAVITSINTERSLRYKSSNKTRVGDALHRQLSEVNLAFGRDRLEMIVFCFSLERGAL